ncbi:hypothetical protein [Nonomuraea sp. NPDC001699]
MIPHLLTRLTGPTGLTRLLRLTGLARLGRLGPPPSVQVRVLFGLPRPPGACRCLLDLPHDPSAHPRAGMERGGPSRSLARHG